MLKRVFILLVVLALAGNVSAALVASYSMEEGSGTAIADGTTNNWDGTFNASPEDPAFSSDAAVGSYSLDLGNTDSTVVELGTGNIQGPGPIAGAFAFSLWYKWAGPAPMWEGKWWSRGQRIIGKMDTWSESNMAFSFQVRDWEQSEDPCGPAGNVMGGDNAHFWLAQPGATAAKWNADANEIALLTRDVWTFVEVKYDGSITASLRVDGGTWYDKVFVPGSDTGSKLFLGGVSKYSFNGLVDDVKFDNVPEPATIALLGLGGLLLRRRRK